MTAIEPFTLHRSDEELADLRRRLDATRWPEPETVEDWSQGAPLSRVQDLCAYWRNSYDWRRCEAMLNGFGQFRTEIEGLGIHFLHVRSPEPDAMPLILTHGWPGSVIEFHKVIRPLTDPAAFGGDPRDAFHLVIPSLPGFGFSDKPRRSGWTVERIAAAWVTLMQRLGYDGFVAQGGDWGAAVATALAHLAPPQLIAIHLNMPIAFPDPAEEADWTAMRRPAIPLCSGPGRRPWATGSPIPRRGRLPGSTRNIMPGPIATAIRLMCSASTRCWTISCSIGCRPPARHPRGSTGKA
jgi:hypothetical protein